MPEWNGYVESGNDAGSLCHRESGFLQEIAQEVAMRASQNVWVDGSLRDSSWYAKVFKGIRRRYPNYKLAIFEVGASETVVRNRIKSRAEETGRNVPEHLITQSLASVAKSLDVLTPLVDFVARINNEVGSPQLRAFIRVDPSGNWASIKNRFARPESAGAFPRSLAPLMLVKMHDLSIAVQHPPDDQYGATPMKSSRRHSYLTFDTNHPALADIAEAMRTNSLDLSPLAPTHLVGDARLNAGIPAEAATFAFAYPANIDWKAMPDSISTQNDISLLALAGGFAYFDTEGVLLGINAVSKFLSDSINHTPAGDAHAHGPTEGNQRPLIQFVQPLPLPAATSRALQKSGTKNG